MPSKEPGRFNIRLPESDADDYREVAGLLGVTVPTLVRTILAQSAPQVRAMSKALREVQAGDDAAAAATMLAAMTALGVNLNNLQDEMEHETSAGGDAV